MKTKFWPIFVVLGIIFAGSLISPTSSQDAAGKSVKTIFFFLAVIFLGYGYSLKKMIKRGIKDTKDYGKPGEKQKPIQYVLKFLFWIMFILWIVSYSIQVGTITLSLLIFSLSFLMITIATFIISIIHLFKFKDKSFSTVTLVLSSVILILTLVSSITSLSTTYETDEYTEDELLDFCEELCIDEPKLEYVSLEVNPDNESNYLCYCQDADEEILSGYRIG